MPSEYKLSMIFHYLLLFFLALTGAAYSSENGIPAQEASQLPAVRSLRIEGNIHYREAIIRKFLVPALRDGLFHRVALDRAVVLLNEMPDLNIVVDSRISENSSSVDLTVKVDDRQNTHLTISCDNFGTQRSGRNRILTELTVSNLLNTGDMVTLKGIEPFGGRTENAQYYGTLSLPLNYTGTRLAASLSNMEILAWDPAGEGEEVNDVQNYRNSRICTLLLTHPLERHDGIASNLLAGFTGKDIHHFTAGLLDEQDKVRNISLGYSWSRKDRWGKTAWSLTATQGLGSFMEGSIRDDFFSSRPFADNDYTRFNGAFSLEHKLGGKTSLGFRGAGQASPDRLLMTEQFPIGGANSVRGFQQNHYRGDSGYFLSAEYRHRLFASGNPGKGSWQAVVFMDNGFVSNVEPFYGELSRQSITGTGIGLRSPRGAPVELRLDAGWPLYPLSRHPGASPLIYGQVITRF